MKIIASTVVKAPILKKDENGDEECKGSFIAGVKLDLDCGTSVYHNIRTGSFKVSYPQVQVYQFGRPATNELGQPLMSKQRVARCNLKQLCKDHSLTFARLILNGVKSELENVE